VIEPTVEMRRAAYDAMPPEVRIAPAALDEVLAAVLALAERDQAAELTELRALFQLQWTRSREADARWRAEDPEARANVWPDLGVLLKWLMDDADQARAELAIATRDNRRQGQPKGWLIEHVDHHGVAAVEGCTFCGGPTP
jgi:hypothetical protein